MSNSGPTSNLQSTSTSIPVQSTITSNTNPQRLWLDKFEGPRDYRRLKWREHGRSERHLDSLISENVKIQNIERIEREESFKATIDCPRYPLSWLSGKKDQPTHVRKEITKVVLEMRQYSRMMETMREDYDYESMAEETDETDDDDEGFGEDNAEEIFKENEYAESGYEVMSELDDAEAKDGESNCDMEVKQNKE